VIFHKQSMLSSYLGQSPGQCDTLEEVHLKLKQILEKDDQDLIRRIIIEQNKVRHRLIPMYNTHIFDDLIA